MRQAFKRLDPAGQCFRLWQHDVAQVFNIQFNWATGMPDAGEYEPCARSSEFSPSSSCAAKVSPEMSLPLHELQRPVRQLYSKVMPLRKAGLKQCFTVRGFETLAAGCSDDGHIERVEGSSVTQRSLAVVAAADFGSQNSDFLLQVFEFAFLALQECSSQP